MFNILIRKKQTETILAFFIALVLVLPLFGQMPWPPISSEEMNLKDCAEQPGAAAICLYYEEITNDELFITKVFKRLKILTAAGLEQANIEIPFYKGSQLVTDIEARVVYPNGRALTFIGEIFEKMAIRARGIRIAVKTFALPDVHPGCIIDYRYKIIPDLGGSSGSDDELLAELQLSRGKPEEGGYPKSIEILSFPGVHWDVQGDLFIRKARFEYVSWPYIWALFQRSCRLAWISRGIEIHKPEITSNQFSFEVQNVPAFAEEEFMTPGESERMSVDVFYLDQRINDYKEYWARECKAWQESAEKFIGNPRKLVPLAEALIGDATDPLERLKKIYERAQNIRNLSYEKGLTRKQRKEQKIKVNNKAADVLERNYGLRSDITRTFVALARAAGFEADIARVSTRDDKLFRMMLLTFYAQLDSELALVDLGDKTMLFDPATPFCPFGLVHWSRTNAAAVRFSEKPPAFFTTQVYPPELALTQREVVLRLSPQGHLGGTVKTTYTGHEALVRRLEYIHDDKEDIRKNLEEELIGVLPLGASVTMKRLDNIDNNNPELIVEYNVTIPGLVTQAGDRILLPASPLLGAKQYPFRHAQRRYPVYFPYAFREFNDIVITVPEGLKVETRPEPKKTQREFAAYSLVCIQETPQRVHIQRDLVIQRNYFPVEHYAAIKAFFDTVRTHDEEQFILGQEKELDVSLRVEQGISAFKRGDYDACIMDMEAVLRIDPRNTSAQYFLSEAKKRKSETEREQQINNRLWRAQNAYQRGDYQACIKQAQEVLDLEPGKLSALNLLNEAKKKIEDRDRKQQIREGLQKAQQAYQEENYRECLTQAKIVISLDPNNAQASEYLNLANEKISVSLIKAFVNEYVQAVNSGELLDFYKKNCSSECYQDVKSDAELIIKYFSNHQSSATNIDVRLKGTNKAEVRFFNTISGTNTAGTKQDIVKGDYRWDLEKGEDNWKIIEISSLRDKRI